MHHFFSLCRPPEDAYGADLMEDAAAAGDGLGLGLSTNAHNPNQFKFELMLLAEYDEGFSTVSIVYHAQKPMICTKSSNALLLHDMHDTCAVHYEAIP